MTSKFEFKEGILDDEDFDHFMTKGQARAFVNSIISLIPEGMSIRLGDTKSDLTYMFMISPRDEVDICLRCRNNEIAFNLLGEILIFNVSHKDNTIQAMKEIVRDCGRLTTTVEAIVNSLGTPRKPKKSRR